MKITNSIRSLILNALRSKKMSQTDLSEKMGFGKSWTSKLLSGTLKTLSDDAADKLEEVLDVKLTAITEKGRVSPVALELSKLMEESEPISKIVNELLALSKDAVLTPRYVPTKEMGKIGNEIIRICYANEDKPGKVARLVLEMLA